MKKPKKPIIPGDPMVIGLSHHTASVDVRERMAIPEIDWDKAANEIKTLNGVDEAGVLSTCNRFEVYLVTRNRQEAQESVMQYAESHSGLDRSTLTNNLFFLHGDKAVDHLLNVSAGFDSLVVGEGQILSQVKNCNAHGISQQGGFGTILAKLFNTAIKSGKRSALRQEFAKVLFPSRLQRLNWPSCVRRRSWASLSKRPGSQ
jgi:glutamyl-tRNA reductase